MSITIVAVWLLCIFAWWMAWMTGKRNKEIRQALWPKPSPRLMSQNLPVQAVLPPAEVRTQIIKDLQAKGASRMEIANFLDQAGMNGEEWYAEGQETIKSIEQELGIKDDVCPECGGMFCVMDDYLCPACREKMG